jgi:hypothetical protein
MKPKPMTNQAPAPLTPAPPAMPTNDAASEFIGVYVALTNYAGRNPPQPFADAVARAIQVLAPLAASVLIQDKLNSQAKA